MYEGSNSQLRNLQSLQKSQLFPLSRCLVPGQPHCPPPRFSNLPTAKDRTYCIFIKNHPNKGPKLMLIQPLSKTRGIINRRLGRRSGKEKRIRRADKFCPAPAHLYLSVDAVLRCITLPTVNLTTKTTTAPVRCLLPYPCRGPCYS